MTKNAIGLFTIVLIIGISLLIASGLSDSGSVEKLTFGVFGIILTTIGGIPFLVRLIKALKKKRFRDKHVMIPATVDRIEVLKEYKEAGKHPVRFYCSYIQNGKRYEFVSFDAWDAPKYRVGDKIKVYAEPNDYSKYMMDVYNQL